ncbi:MAG: hypothetical protein KJZ73_13090 [Pseudorhodoplanes sp.]|nr:hypothetical protein [Pseudorhodoplanes sp.]
MAHWQAEALLFVDGRLIMPGETFESDAVPGRNWRPLDDAKANTVTAPAPLSSPDRKSGDPVEIPENWRGLRPERRINLARRLGAPVRGTGTAEADRTIEAELAMRATV